VKYRLEPKSAYFIPRVRSQVRKAEPQIRSLSWRQLLDVSVMQEQAVTLSAGSANTDQMNQINHDQPASRSSESRRVTGCLSPSSIGLLFFFLIHSFMYAYGGAICFELFRTDSITPSGKINA
jgi:hypothetical protein